jgi:multimeric flavodoxin WrbA
MAAESAKRLLLVWHSRTGLSRQMSDSIEIGAYDVAQQMGCGPEMFKVTKRRASDVAIDDVLESSGYLFCCPENLACASGEMLEFFHRSYYHAFATGSGGEVSMLAGRPYGLAIAAGTDGSGAVHQIQRICRGWRLRPVAEPLVHRNGEPQTPDAILRPKLCSSEAKQRCAELGGLVAATILL